MIPYYAISMQTAHKRCIFIVLLSLILAISSLAKTKAQGKKADHESKAQDSSEPAHPCLFNFEQGYVPDCIQERTPGELFIAPRYLKELHFDSNGLAAVLSEEHGWLYANRRGRVLITGVAAMNNGADWFHDGLVRIVKDKKWGFANRQGTVVVPAIYDGAMDFENGIAQVCVGCQDTCADADCEHHSLTGGEWFQINIKGEKLHGSNSLDSTAESGRGSVCVAPIPEKPPATAGTPELLCKSGKLSFQIDSLHANPWPTKQSTKIAGLSLTGRHRVIVLCDEKPQQSFTFRFSSYKRRQLCFFLNDLYQTAQLWHDAPWCSCQ